MPTSNCLLCSAELEYFRTPRQMQCALCGQMYETTAACKAGHFVCDACHLKKGAELILEVCSSSKSRNPIALIQQIMAQPQIYMHGPEHHILVGAVLLTAYHNSGGELKLQTALSEMSRRGQQIPGGTCGFWGCCGAGRSDGAAAHKPHTDVRPEIQTLPLARKPAAIPVHRRERRAAGVVRFCRRTGDNHPLYSSIHTAVGNKKPQKRVLAVSAVRNGRRDILTRRADHDRT